MARSSEGTRLTARHRELQLRVRAATLRDLLRLWGTVDATNLRGTIGPFAAAAVTVSLGRRRQSATAAMRYAQEFRRAEGIAGTLGVVIPPPPPVAQATDTLRGAGLAGVVRARRAGSSIEASARNGFVKVVGSATALVLNGGREALRAAVNADRSAAGYQRITSGGCEFCAMLASRGPVYKSEDSGGFQAHDHCTCSLEPVYE